MTVKTKQRPNLDLEMEVLLQFIGVGKNRESAIAERLKSGINWAALETIAHEHNVLPLLYTQLKKINAAQVEPGIMQGLENRFKFNARRSLKLTQTLHWLIRLLEKNNIEAIAFKGPVLAVQAYGNLETRAFADLDILVDVLDFDRLFELMTEAGLRCNVRLNKHTKKYWKRFRKNVEFADDINIIDVHFQVTPGPRSFGLEEKIRRRYCTAELLIGNIPAPCPEHSLVILCVQGAQDGWSSLRTIADIAHLVSRHPELDWRRLFSDARSIGCLRMVNQGLRLSHILCGLEPPPGTPGIKKINNLIHLSRKTHKLNKTRAFIRAMDSAMPRLKYLSYYIFTPTLSDLKTVALPGFLSPLYFLVRPVRLVIKGMFHLPGKMYKKKTRRAKT